VCTHRNSEYSFLQSEYLPTVGGISTVYYSTTHSRVKINKVNIFRGQIDKLPNDAASYPRKTDASSTPLKKQAEKNLKKNLTNSSSRNLFLLLNCHQSQLQVSACWWTGWQTLSLSY